MFPPEIPAGATNSPLIAGEMTSEERETERINRSEQQQLSSSPPLTAVPLRRVHSEYTFRFPDEINLIGEHFDVGSPGTSGSFERVPAKDNEDDDDLLASYLDLEKIDGVDIVDRSLPTAVNYDDQNAFRRCRSVDDLCGGALIHSNGDGDKKAKDETCEVKKAMSPDKLAELWVLDPKRAKRILANRQSAARSKERKARYMVELEKRVQSLQTEATSLSVQLSLFERDTNGLTSENTELRRQLESLEQHAQLRDALIDALKQEIDRLKAATGEATTTTDTFIMPIQNIPQSQPQPQQPQPQLQSLMVDSSQPKLPPLYPYDSSIPNPNHVELHRPKMSHLPSFELINIPLDSKVKTKKSRLNPPEPTSMSSLQQAMDPSNVKSFNSMVTFDPNLLNLPQPSKVPSIYPLDNNAGLYLPIDSSKPRMPQFCITETNMQHATLQTGDSTHGLLTQDPFQPNFLSSGGQWAGPGAVLDRSGLVPVGYWAV